MCNYEQRANKLIKDLQATIEIENKTIEATKSDDRKTGCKMRIDMANWGISICNFILTGNRGKLL